MMSSSTTTSSVNLEEDLPEPWYAFKDEKSGERYYYNAETEETTWHRPVKKLSNGDDERIEDLKRNRSRPTISLDNDRENVHRSTISSDKDDEIADLRRQLSAEKNKVLKVIRESEKVVMQSLSEQAKQLHQIEHLSSQLEEVNSERVVLARRADVAEKRTNQLETQLRYLREELETERNNANDGRKR